MNVHATIDVRLSWLISAFT